MPYNMKPGPLFLTLLFIAIYSPLSAQQYTVDKQRLQFKLISSFVFFSMQGQLDMDSAAILVSEGEYLPYTLHYDEDYAKGPDNNIKKSLKKRSEYLFKAGYQQCDLDNARITLVSAKEEAEKA